MPWNLAIISKENSLLANYCLYISVGILLAFVRYHILALLLLIIILQVRVVPICVCS